MVSAGAPDPFLAFVERAARDQNVDLTRYERALAMLEAREQREAHRAFNAALAAAKGELGPIVKNREVDFSTQKGRTHYRHEDFAQVARTVDPVFARHGLSYRFRAVQSGKKLTVTCIVSHASGHSEETTLEADNDESGNKNTIQSVGSAATYLQRYTLKLALGLAAAEDEDGRAADPGPPFAMTADEIAYVEQLIRDTDSDMAIFLETIGAKIPEFNAEQYKRALALLNEKKRRAKEAAQKAEAASGAKK